MFELLMRRRVESWGLVNMELAVGDIATRLSKEVGSRSKR